MIAKIQAAKSIHLSLFLPLVSGILLSSCSTSGEISNNKKEDSSTKNAVEELSAKEQTKKEIVEMVTSQLEKAGFKFDQSKKAFTRSQKDYRDEITVQANNRGDFYFHFGRIFPAVADMVAPFQAKKLFSTPDLTVWDSSMNAGPNFPEHYKTEGGWNLSADTKAQVKKEVSDFIKDFMLVWLDKFPDLKAAREKLERRPMIKAETTIQILAIDVLLKDKKAFHQELDRSMPTIENSTSRDAPDKVQSFVNDVYKQHPEFKQK